MGRNLLAIGASALIVLLGACSEKDHADADIEPVPFTDVQVNDEFWAAKINLISRSLSPLL